MKILPADVQRNYAEIGQTATSKFSFVNEQPNGDFKEIFTPVKCRDFLGDAVYNTKSNIYGFSWDPDKQKIDEDATKLSMHFAKQHEADSFVEHFAYLNEIETKNGLDLTVLYKESSLDYVVVGDKFWQSAIWTISLYTYILRSLGASMKPFTKAFEALPGNWSAGYYSSVKPNWKKLTSSLKKIRKACEDRSGWLDSPHISQLHNCSGFVYVFGSTTSLNVFSKAFRELK